MCTFLNFFKRAEQEHQLGVCVGKHRDVFNACYMVKKKKDPAHLYPLPGKISGVLFHLAKIYWL